MFGGYYQVAAPRTIDPEDSYVQDEVTTKVFLITLMSHKLWFFYYDAFIMTRRFYYDPNYPDYILYFQKFLSK